jgi:hypothetical protein
LPANRDIEFLGHKMKTSGVAGDHFCRVGKRIFSSEPVPFLYLLPKKKTKEVVSNLLFKYRKEEVYFFIFKNLEE